MIFLKKVFITGSGSGLGKEAAISLAKRGHTVYASVQYESEIKDLQDIAKSNDINLIAFKLDILNEADRNTILNYDFDTFISNAAIGNSGSVADIPVDFIEDVFNTNVFSNLKVIQLAIKNIIDRYKKGRIIILSSLVGRIPMPFLAPYCASKFALNGFAICLKQELKILKKLSAKSKCEDIDLDVCVIEPGAYATGFNKENNEKKYSWMTTSSYFSPYINLIKDFEIKVWNFLEQKPFTPIVKCYIKAVEAKKPRFRYSAPWWQTMFIQILRILGK